LRQHYDRYKHGPRGRLTGGLLSIPLSVGLLGLVLAAVCMGHLETSWLDAIKIIASHISGFGDARAAMGEVLPVVIWDVRLPRILTSILVGGGLAVSGTVFQGLLLNPLADPYTLGVSAGAAFGASLAILLNLGFLGNASVPLFAFLGACATLALVIYLSSASKSLSSHNLILSGIIVTAILSAGISFLKYMADEQVSVIIFWLMGSFASKTWTDVGLAAGAICAGTIVCLIFSRDLNMMSLGRRSAAALGVDTRQTTLILLVSASMMAAACVSVSGIIGFIGLLVPHMMRTVTGPDNRVLIPVSMGVGAGLLLLGDTITRAVLPHELPIGVLTALIGGPFFCYIFRRRQRGGSPF
jgi:iron complex transport system permease protein